MKISIRTVCTLLIILTPGVVFAAAGDLDVSFSGDGVVNWSAATQRPSFGPQKGVVQADGKILVVGIVNPDPGSPSLLDDNAGIARFFADGTIDTSFGVNGVISTDIPAFGVGGRDNWATDIVVQSDGKFIVGGGVWTGAAQYENMTLTRYNANGSLDTTFAGTGYVVLDFGLQDMDILNDLKIQADGKIVVAGTTWNVRYRFAVARFNANGSLDTTFSGDGLVTTAMSTADSNGSEVVVQADGKIVVSGTAWQGTTRKDDIAVARYLSNGNLDTSFDSDGKAYVNFANLYDNGSALALQADGKLVIAGPVDSSSVGTASKFGVVRLTAAGKLDTTFDGDGKAITPFLGYDFANDLVIQGDGKIVVVGGTRQPDNAYAPVVARYNVNGSLDNSFSGDGKVQSSFVDPSGIGYTGVAIDGNGKILAVDIGNGARYLSQ